MNPYKAPLLLSVLAGAWLTSCATTAHDGYVLAPTPSADPHPQAAAGPESGGLIAIEVARANAAIVAIVDLPDDQRTIANTLTAVDDVQWEFIQSVRMDGFLASVSTDAAVRDRGGRDPGFIHAGLVPLPIKSVLFSKKLR